MSRLATEREASAAEVAELRKEVSILFIACLGGRPALCLWWPRSSSIVAAAFQYSIHMYVAFTSTTFDLNWVGIRSWRPNSHPGVSA